VEILAAPGRTALVCHFIHSLRWAAAEGVSEDVISAVLLLHETSVDEVTDKQSSGELAHVVRLVGRNPRVYPPGTLEDLKGKLPPRTESDEPCSTTTGCGHPAHAVVQSAVHTRQMRDDHERRLAIGFSPLSRSAPEVDCAGMSGTSALGLGRVKTQSDLVVMPGGRQIFAFFRSPDGRRAPKFRVRLYRLEFSHSQGHFRPGQASTTFAHVRYVPESGSKFRA
jgi:hypothetical protein